MVSKTHDNLENIFVIKHNAKSEQEIMTSFVSRLISEYEIKNYEIKCMFWVSNKIEFNGKTIAKGTNIEYTDVQENFIKVIRGELPEL